MKLRYFYQIFLAFFIFLVDIQLTSLLANSLPIPMHVISHSLFILFFFMALEYEKLHLLMVLILLGLMYDIYIFHMIGFATFLLPIYGFILFYLSDTIYKKVWTRIAIILLFVFQFELIPFIIARLTDFTHVNISDFIVFTIFPTIVWNLILFFLLYPLYRKIFI